MVEQVAVNDKVLGSSPSRGASYPQKLICYNFIMKVNWKEVCKFLSGAFFVSSGVIAYLAWNHVAVPVFGRSIPFLVSFPRSIIHFVLFLITFYIGFIKK